MFHKAVTDFDLLTTGDVAKELNRSRELVIHLEKTGKLHALKTVTGRRLFLREDVERLKQKRAEAKRA